jgi:L-2-hydroxyglutarate oxidase LhgO
MWRSWNKRAFVKALARLVPDIRPQDLVPGRSGVRAMAIDSAGQMIDDFLIQPAERMVHVLSAPSPAATSALNIGKLIVDQLAAQGGV